MATEEPLYKCGMWEQKMLALATATQKMPKEMWEINTTCQFAPNEELTAERLRQAWRGIGIEQPNLRSVPVGNDKKRLISVDEWTSQTFVVDHERTAEAITSKEPPRELPSLWWIPASSKIVLLLSHWRSDGIGCMLLIDRLLELLAQGDHAQLQPAAAPTPPIEDVTDSDAIGTSEFAEIGRREGEHISDLYAFCGNLPFDSSDFTPGRIGQYRVNFSKASSSALVAACRAAGVSVTAALNYAVAQLGFAYSNDENLATGFHTLLAANPRPYLSPPYNSHASAAACNAVPLVTFVPRGAAFRDAARPITLQLRTWYTETYRRSLRALFHHFVISPTVPPSAVVLSNLGHTARFLTPEHGSFRLESFHLGVASTDPQIGLHAWTFRDQFAISLSFNHQYHALPKIREYTDHLLATLAQSLDLKLETQEEVVLPDA